jgi:hypothetical protein
VLKILPGRRAVEISVVGVEAPLTLTLNGESNAAPISAGSIELGKPKLLAILEKSHAGLSAARSFQC